MALAFSLKALDSEDKPLSELWSTTLQYYSQYSLEEIAPTLKQVTFLQFEDIFSEIFTLKTKQERYWRKS